MTRFLLVFLIACGATPKKNSAAGATGASGPSGDEVDDGTQTTSTGKDFSIGAQAVAIEQGGSKQVSITLTRQGGSFPVTLSQGEADAGIRITFAQGTVTAASVQATVEVVQSVSPGSHKLIVNASGADKTHSVTLAISVTQKMNGAVVVDELGRPVAGAEIFIGAQPKVTTSAEGTFPLTASGTYEVIVKKDGDVWVFRGLTRLDPTLQLFGYAPDQTFTAQLTGAITNVAAAPSGDATTALVLGTTACCGDTFLDISPDNFDTDLWWSVNSMTNATVHALEWAVQGDITFQGYYANRPITFLRYASKPNVGMSDGQLASALNMDFGSTPLQNGTLSGTVVTPSNDYVLLAREMFVRLPGDNASVHTAHELSASKSFSFPTPVITGATVAVVQGAMNPTKGSSFAYAANLGTTGNPVTLTLPTPPTATVPGGTISATSAFSFTPMSGGALHVMQFLPDFGVTGPRVYIVGTATQATLPNLSAAGVSLPAKAKYYYSVYGFSVGSVDAASSSDGYASGFAAAETRKRAPKGNGSFATSLSKEFTTP